MDTIDRTEMVKHAILGTLVADASSLGLHWIYSQGKIAKIVKDHDDTAEFLEPDKQNYEGVPAFFAHPHKHAGDSSNYGAYIYLLLRTITEEGFDSSAYIRAFENYFGVGGEYVGYADGPMRETIFNIAKLGKEIHQRVMEAGTSLDDEHKSSAAHYISRYFFEFDADGLKEKIRTPLRLQEWSREELEEADRLVDDVKSVAEAIGPDDDQMPALSRSAVLAHFYSGEELDGMVERAVRITNDNDAAVAYSKFMAHIMRDLYEAGDDNWESRKQRFRDSIDANRSLLPEKSQKLIDEATSSDELDYRGVTKRFGAACHVDMGVPVVVHILSNTDTFEDANRANIMASGDNCGRAIMLGALAGVLYGIGGEHGIPEEWIEKTRLIERAKGTSGGTLLLG